MKNVFNVLDKATDSQKIDFYNLLNDLYLSKSTYDLLRNAEFLQHLFTIIGEPHEQRRIYEDDQGGLLR